MIYTVKIELAPYCYRNATKYYAYDTSINIWHDL